MKKRNIDYVGKEVPTETEASNRTRDFPENKQEVADPICYYSKLLQRPFDSLVDLKKAEDEFKAKNALELQKKEERRLDAKKVEDAYKELIEAKKKAADIIDEAEKKYLDEKEAFIKKYHSFHQTFIDDGNKQEITVSDLIDKFFDRPRLPLIDDLFRW